MSQKRANGKKEQNSLASLVDDADFVRSQEVQDIIGKMPPWIVRSGMFYLFIIMLLVVIVTALIPAPETATASILISKSGNYSTVTSNSNLTIDTIYVSEGEFVNAEEIVLRYQAKANYKDILRVESLLKRITTDYSQALLDSLHNEYNLGDLQSRYQETIYYISLIEKSSNKTIENQIKIHDATINMLGYLNAWKAKYILRAPIDGIINFSRKFHTGDVMREKEIVAQVSPDNESINIKGVANSNEKGKLQQGQKARIKVDGYNPQQYGIISSEVLSISKVPIENQIFIEFSCDKPLKFNNKTDVPLYTTLTGVAEITVKDRSLLEKIFTSYLLKN